MYNKIIEQSKENSIIKINDSEDSLNLEFLQINLSIVLWYMKSKKIKKKFLDLLIGKFIEDLEAASIELGFAESSLKKKVRRLANNFYENLDANLRIINELLENEGEILSKNILCQKYEKKNTNFKKLEKYYKRNIKLFINLDEKRFWNLDFNFIDK